MHSQSQGSAGLAYAFFSARLIQVTQSVQELAVAHLGSTFNEQEFASMHP